MSRQQMPDNQQKDFIIIMMQMTLTEMKRVGIVSADEFQEIWARIPQRVNAAEHPA